ncbi:MAG: flagellar hook-basal body complex protein [Phycisphaerae bacterium]|nr:flagellar hook-basal body complex protein [Phycisphaerae bacterium]
MSNALLAGVSGLRANQKMIDVAGSNLANVNTNAYKASRITFADLMSETTQEASQPTASVGGTNPAQVGSGVQIASIDRDMAAGSLFNTGQPLDMAIEGAGYFVLNDGTQDVFTRVGTFAVDSEFYLVDPGTGYRVQRVGSEGVSEGFQDPTSDAIRVPYDVALPAQATENITYNGNLSADQTTPTQHTIDSGIQYTIDGASASGDTLIKDLDQVDVTDAGGTIVGGTLAITGTDRDGTAVSDSVTVVDAVAGAGEVYTMDDLLAHVSSLYDGSTASLVNGEIHLTDDETGYSQANLHMAFSGGTDATLELPEHWQITKAGGQEVKNTNVEVFDSQGNSHILSAAFVKTDTANQWDMVLTTITGDVELVDRRVKGITFLSDGAFGGLAEATPPEAQSFKMKFAHDPDSEVEVNVDLGTVGQYDGLSQFGGSSTVSPSGQDGYASGALSSVSVTREGVLVGVFTNGARRDLAAIKVATFQNPAGLLAIGDNYYEPSANSGEPVPTKAMSGGAGAVHGGSLEGSNVDMANEFVNLIQAQNAFQANARTITTSNEMLRELTNLIR